MKREINYYDEKQNKVKDVSQAKFLELIVYDNQDKLKTISYYIQKPVKNNQPISV